MAKKNEVPKAMKTLADVMANMRKTAEDLEKHDFYDLRSLSTDSLRAYADQIGTAVNRINKELKAIQKSHPKATWNLGHEYDFAYCSNCGHMQFSNWDTRQFAIKAIQKFHEVYKFCPNCGAKMNGE